MRTSLLCSLTDTVAELPPCTAKAKIHVKEIENTMTLISKSLVSVGKAVTGST